MIGAMSQQLQQQQPLFQQHTFPLHVGVSQQTEQLAPQVTYQQQHQNVAQAQASLQQTLSVAAPSISESLSHGAQLLAPDSSLKISQHPLDCAKQQSPDPVVAALSDAEKMGPSKDPSPDTSTQALAGMKRPREQANEELVPPVQQVPEAQQLLVTQEHAEASKPETTAADALETETSDKHSGGVESDVIRVIPSSPLPASVTRSDDLEPAVTDAVAHSSSSS